MIDKEIPRMTQEQYDVLSEIKDGMGIPGTFKFKVDGKWIDLSCALCIQLSREDKNGLTYLFCKATGGSFSESICDKCKEEVRQDFYSSFQVALGEADSLTRTIYPPHIMLGIAQEALDELKRDYSQEGIEKRRKELYDKE